MDFLSLGLQSYPLRRWDWGGCQEGPVIPSEEVRLEVWGYDHLQSFGPVLVLLFSSAPTARGGTRAGPGRTELAFLANRAERPRCAWPGFGFAKNLAEALGFLELPVAEPSHFQNSGHLEVCTKPSRD